MRILLISNDTVALERSLRRHGFSVDTMRDCWKAEHQLKNSEQGLVLLDLELPGALAALARWRHDGVDAHILALACPNAMAPTSVVDALDAGADAAIARPCPTEELMARLRALNRRRQPAAEPELNVFDLKIRTAARVVSRAGKSINLTRREFAMLHFMACRRGKAVSPAMIWSHLNQGLGPIRSNVIAVYARYLRSKIDAGFELPLILTVRGKGYMLRGEFEEEHRTSATHEQSRATGSSGFQRVKPSPSIERHQTAS